MKKMIILLMLVVLIGCKAEDNDKKLFNPDDNLDLENIFFDDFKNGIDIDKWEIAYQQWGYGNNGVIHKNVNYTEDGIVVLQANGDLYAGDFTGVNSTDGRRTGGALITNEAFGPGRYEVRMKVLPRFGATTAFWTYYYHHATDENHEIDIEINVNNDFRETWFTNWLTVDDSEHRKVNTEVVHNDGEWHTYKFEWHTNPERIDYYIDDVLLHTSYSRIPTFAGRLWVGNWFPNGWAGTPDFETDYTLIDWVRFTPYLNNPYVETDGGRSNFPNEYPTEPIELPQNNLVSNAGFEGREEAWRKETTSSVQIVEEEGINGSNALFVPHDDITYQFITGMDETFEMIIKVSGKFDEATSDGGYVLIDAMPLDTRILESFIIHFDSSDDDFVDGEYYEKILTFSLPEGTRRIKLNLIGGSTGGIYFDNLYMNLVSKTP
jgi:beta-glucanase (GH16 family)